jgi:hypothetical protein
MVANERTGPEEKKARLSDPDVRRWYDNLARGSVITADNYLRSLYNFSRRMEVSPSEIAQFTPKKAYDTILDYVSGEEKRGMAGSATVTYVKAVKSWLAFHRVKLEQKIRVRGADQAPTLKDEEVPTQDGLRSILLASNARLRPAHALVAFSGVRLEVIGNYTGTDGLRVGDLKGLEIEKDKVAFESLPARVIVRADLSKTGKSYFSFIGAEGAGYISAALEERIRAGEKITAESAVVAPLSSKKPFYVTKKLSTAMRTGIEKAGFDFRPYNLRCYFDTQGLLAESKGKVAHDYRVFWMGHTGSMENRYTTNKGKLPKELITDMAEAYHRCEAFLGTLPTEDEKGEVEARMKASLLETVGFSAEEAQKIVRDEGADIAKLGHEKLKERFGSIQTGPARDEFRGAEARAKMREGWNLVEKFDEPGGAIYLLERPH